MARCDPSVRTCISRYRSMCHTKSVQIRERGRDVKKELLMYMDAQMSAFLSDCIEMAFICGFVAFYVKKKNNRPEFFCLPMGTFSWTVKFCETPSENDLLRYDVKCNCGGVTEKDIHVVNYIQPALRTGKESVNWSPMQQLLDLFILRNRQISAALVVEEWNERKHIAVTEKVDLKDPTTSGLQLLDDLKRYNLTGKHGNMDRNSLLRLRTQNNTNIDTTTEGTFQWVHSVFGGPTGQPCADVHIMPPNTEVQELGNLQSNAMYEYFQDLFEKSVLSYFDIPGAYVPKNGSTDKESQMSGTQYKNITNMSRFCEKVTNAAYCVGFGANPDEVEVAIQATSRLELKSIADLKVLMETGIITPQDKMRLRKLLFES